MASIGAFVAGPKDIIDYIRYNIRSQIFAKSLPMPLVIGNLKRLELLRTHPELKEKLWSNARKLQNGLKERGFDIGKTDSPVTPVYMKGGVEEATAMVMDLRENYGIFARSLYILLFRKDISFIVLFLQQHILMKILKQLLRHLKKQRKNWMRVHTKSMQFLIWQNTVEKI